LLNFTDVLLIYQGAIKANASGKIICHNHPSDNVQPSESDIKITKKIKDSDVLMDTKHLDHLNVIPEWEYYCIAHEGIL
jgi:DNA repair protein RadC